MSFIIVYIYLSFILAMIIDNYYKLSTIIYKISILINKMHFITYIFLLAYLFLAPLIKNIYQ
jgi:hypothetical protein